MDAQQQLEMREWFKENQEYWGPDDPDLGDIDLSELLQDREYCIDEDVVNHPSHYQSENGLEVIQVIDDFVPSSYDYYMGNSIKYLLRHLKKSNARQDLEKCRFYINKMLETYDA